MNTAALKCFFLLAFYAVFSPIIDNIFQGRARALGQLEKPGFILDDEVLAGQGSYEIGQRGKKIQGID